MLIMCELDFVFVWVMGMLFVTVVCVVGISIESVGEFTQGWTGT